MWSESSSEREGGNFTKKSWWKSPRSVKSISASCIPEKHIGFIITFFDFSKDFLCALGFNYFQLCLVWFVIKFAIKRIIRNSVALRRDRGKNNELWKTLLSLFIFETFFATREPSLGDTFPCKLALKLERKLIQDFVISPRCRQRLS